MKRKVHVGCGVLFEFFFLEQAILNKALSTFIVFILMRTEVQIIFNKMVIFKCNFVYTYIF